MSPIKTSTLTLRTILKYLFGSLLVLFLVAYVIFQARLLIEGPILSLTDEPKTVQTSRSITLSGTAENITDITLNGRHIMTDEAGNFSEPIVLENGYTIVSIEAEDRYGRRTKLEREFVYTPLSLFN